MVGFERTPIVGTHIAHLLAVILQTTLSLTSPIRAFTVSPLTHLSDHSKIGNFARPIFQFLICSKSLKYPINVIPLHDCVPLVVDSSQKNTVIYLYVWSLKCGKRSQSSRGPNTFARHCIYWDHVTNHVTLRLHTCGLYLTNCVTSEGNLMHQILFRSFIANGVNTVEDGRLHTP
jgi:hypothetical protein